MGNRQKMYVGYEWWDKLQATDLSGMESSTVEFLYPEGTRVSCVSALTLLTERIIPIWQDRQEATGAPCSRIPFLLGLLKGVTGS
jgi:hypothetical protein